MIKAMLFDLDDTLVDLNLPAFGLRYIRDLSKLIGKIAHVPYPFLMPAFAKSYLAIDQRERKDDLLNEELFNKTFFSATGIPLAEPAIKDAIDCFEHEIVPGYQNGWVMARPQKGMRRAIDKAHDLGLTVALATNPVFSLELDLIRIKWAELCADDFADITTISNSYRCKPCAAYYEHFITKLGFTPSECLMVGNDALRDFPRPGIGLKTLYVGHANPKRAFWRGRPEKLSHDLKEIIEYANSGLCK